MGSTASSQIVVVFLFCLFHRSMFDPVSAASSGSVTASITRKLAFPDFKDKEKTDAITLLGSAAVDRLSGEVRIPKSVNGSSPRDLANQAGRALYSFPFRMMDPETKTTSSFHTTFSFRIDKLAAGPNISSDSGLTFLIVPDELTVGRNGGWLGMINDVCDETYKPFAVEFDTFKNEEFQDPNDHHIGINVGSIVSHTTADAHSAGVSFHDGSIVRAWISYNNARRSVDVRVAKEGAPKPLKALISTPLDLSKIFKEYMFVGFSGGTGSTGFTTRVHSILSWHFSSDSTGMLRFPKHETCAKLLLPNLLKKKRTPSAFIIFCLVILIVFLAFLNFVCVPRKRRDGTLAPKLLQARGRPRPLHQPRRFSLEEILEATRLFSEGEVLGVGRRGIFFSGVLADGSQAAIKRYSPRFFQQVRRSDYKKLSKEVAILSRLQHPNLVPLRGWCLDKGELLLIYEYMPNGSLDKWLFSHGVLPWVRRYKVVKEIASALAFLHSGWEKTVVHMEVKASNVLLDVTFRARLGDFGVKSQRGAQAEVVSSAAPNEGKSSSAYVPPEIGQVREATKEMDVYSFGVMVLEIVTGVRAEGAGLVDRVWSLEEAGRLKEAVDGELVARTHLTSCMEEATRVLRTGLLCTQEDPSLRPCMEKVVNYLNGEACVFEELELRSLWRRKKKLLPLEADPHHRHLYARNSHGFNICSAVPIMCIGDPQRRLSLSSNYGGC